LPVLLLVTGRAWVSLHICSVRGRQNNRRKSASDLITKKAPEHGIPGIILASVSLIAMPTLSQAKKKVGKELGSAAMNADARQTDFSAYLSSILLAGLLLNAMLGWWWADPVAAITMLPNYASDYCQRRN
jgi:hypothetical protein